MRERDAFRLFWLIIDAEYRRGEPRAIRARITGRFLANAGEVIAQASVAEFLRTTPVP
jgi:hypothetical protein